MANWCFQIASPTPDTAHVALWQQPTGQHGTFDALHILTRLSPTAITSAICALKDATVAAGHHWPIDDRDSLRAALMSQVA